MASFQFGSFTLDLDRLCVFGSCGQAELRPKSFEVLRYLVEHAGRVVGKEEVIKAVWFDVAVTDESLTRCISEVRRALGDGSQQIVKTVPRRGYLLDVPISGGDVTQKLPDRPSIAVLPFDNLSRDANQEYFADGMAENLITDLSKMSGLFVIARNSTFVYKGKSVDVRRVARDLGVRYVVEGSVRKGGSLTRITAQLLDGATGGHLWAERYDRDLKDIFEVQDEVTRAIVAALSVELTPVERKSLAHRGTVNLYAYEHYLRGRQFAYTFTNAANVQALSAFQEAVAIDPNFAAAHAMLAYCMVVNFINRWGEPEDRSIDRAIQISQKAVHLEGSEPRAHFALGVAYFWSKQHDDAIAEEERAIALEPNFADAYAALAQIFCYVGRPKDAIERLAIAMRLDPQYLNLVLHILGHAHFLLEQYEDAVTALRRRLVRNPDSDMSRVLLAACYGHLGRHEQACIEWNEALRINPDYSFDQRRKVLPYKNLSDFERIVDGVRKAGLLD